LVVVDALGERRYTARDFPLSIGGAGSTIVLAGLPEEIVAYLGWHESDLFVQPASVHPLSQNGAPLTSSNWLRAGDVVEIGAARIRAVDRGGSLTLEVDDGSSGNITAPPIAEHTIKSAEELAESERIEAVRFRAAQAGQLGTRKSVPVGRWVAAAAGLVLAVAAWFIFTARAVSITTEPEQAKVRLSGMLPALKWEHRFLAQPGDYRLQVDEPGYRANVQQIKVGDLSNQTVSVTLEKLPGHVKVDVPAAATIIVDAGKPANVPAEIELAAGEHKVSIASDRYLDFAGTLAVTGGGAHQVFRPQLVPKWAMVTINSEPSGAEIVVDGQSRGKTPAAIEVMAGRHPLELRHESFKPWTTDIQVKANEPLDLGSVKLGVPDGELTVRSDPSGAGVTVSGVYRGVTPLTVTVRPDVGQPIAVAKAGYETSTREIALKASERRALEVALTGIYGELTLHVQPADAQLFVDGQARGTAQQQSLKLLATAHEIELKKSGYASYKTTVTPRPGIAQVVETELVTQEQAHMQAYANLIHSKGGPTLKLMPRGEFTMGSARREPGRRANEVQRTVQLQRPFYVGVYTVTNAEYHRFKPDHHSGFAGNSTLELETQPVVSITWDQAVEYCNWLSQQDGLQPAYVQKDGKWAAATPMTTGYRLPTDAEWEFVARYTGPGGSLLRYPWGDSLPVAPRSGNYADVSARVVLEDIVPNYDDGFTVTAPVGKFPPNKLGIYDMGGNVSEWAHDYYTVGAEATKPLVDPMGPTDGTQHVIRGSSWRDASATDLRLSARDFGERSRNDVGLRVVRYAE
jgi:formylglycine-generating enzyme required for sulfatase activity